MQWFVTGMSVIDFAMDELFTEQKKHNRLHDHKQLMESFCWAFV